MRWLDFEETYLVEGNGNECHHDLLRSTFSPAQLPVLRQISIDSAALEEDPSRFNRILPHLDHFEFHWVLLSSVALQLPHCTSLKKLHLTVGSNEDHVDSLSFFISLRLLHLEKFGHCHWQDEDEESSLCNVRSIMAIVGEMKTLKKLSLAVVDLNDDSEVGKKWRDFKEGVRKMCQSNKVHMNRYDDNDERLERHELTWVD